MSRMDGNNIFNQPVFSVVAQVLLFIVYMNNGAI
jgi:hypothetical protein